MRYVFSHLRGVLAMAFNHEGWQNYFDRTLEGVYRSFWVIIPGILITAIVSFSLSPAIEEYLQSSSTEPVISPVSLPIYAQLIMILIRDVLDRIASLWFLYALAKKLPRKIDAINLILGYNWQQFLISLLMLIPVIILELTGNKEMAIVMMTPVLIVSLVLIWGVFKRAMFGIDAPLIALAIIGVIIVGFLVTSSVSAVAIRLWG